MNVPLPCSLCGRLARPEHLWWLRIGGHDLRLHDPCSRLFAASVRLWRRVTEKRKRCRGR